MSSHDLRQSIFMKGLILCAIMIVALGFLWPRVADAINPYSGEGNPIIGAKVIVKTTGDVTATLVHANPGAFYDDYLYISTPSCSYTNASPNAIGSNWIFQTDTTPVGTVVDLGTFAAGTELVFNVLADTHGADLSQNTQGYLNWYTGPASRNADGFAHAWVDNAYTGPYGGVAVGFEDESATTYGSTLNNGQLGPGDAGYEDLIYTFSNVSSTGGLWKNATSKGEDWYYLSWFGYFNTEYSPWIYHKTLGWLYPFGTSTDNVWIWDNQWDGHGGFWWTSASAFPWVYSWTDKAWFWYDAAASTPGSRLFWNSSDGKWEKH